MDLSKTKLYKAIFDPRVKETALLKLCHDYVDVKKNVNLTDDVTRQTFLHVMCAHGGRLRTPWGVTVIYLMASSGLNLDARDVHGDTCLHATVRVPGSFRIVIALMRCGVDPLIKNNAGQTAEETLLEEKPEQWQQTLHWLNKYSPGLYHTLMSDQIDLQFTERLLRGWVRTRLTRQDGQEVDIVNVMDLPDSVRTLLGKYSTTNEFVIRMLADRIAENGLNYSDIDINTQDYMNEVDTVHMVPVPVAKPLLMAVWETRNEEAVDALLNLGVDSSVRYSHTGSRKDAEPLVFHLIGKNKRIPDNIVHKILSTSNLDLRDQHGQTVLFKAITHDYSHQFIKALFKYGVNLTSRHSRGRTARDFAESLKKYKYFNVIDEEVVNIVSEGDLDKLQVLVLQGYDHIVDITDEHGFNMINIIQRLPLKDHKQDVLTFVEKIPSIQHHLTLMFRATDTGDTDELQRFTSRKFAMAQDKCGRTILHRAILNKKKEMIKFIVNNYRHIIDMQDNLGRTALHYAYLITEDVSLVNYLVHNGISTQIRDYSGRLPLDYSIHSCGKEEYLRLQLTMKSFTMEVYLAETNFEQALLKAVKKGELSLVEELVLGLSDKGDLSRYANVLFKCVDEGKQDIAIYLIKQGIRTDIYKQYDHCSASSSACSNYTCKHTLTSFYARAKQQHCMDVVAAINELSGNKYDHCSASSSACSNYTCKHTLTSFYARAKQQHCMDVVSAINELSGNKYDHCSASSSACSNYTCKHTLTSFYARAKQQHCMDVVSAINELSGNKYDHCSASSSACSNYTCKHTLTSFYARAKQQHCMDVVSAINELSGNKKSIEVDGRPPVTKPSTMDQLSLLGLL